MEWINTLLWDSSSIAHIVLLYAFVIAGGVTESELLNIDYDYIYDEVSSIEGIKFICTSCDLIDFLPVKIEI